MTFHTVPDRKQSVVVLNTFLMVYFISMVSIGLAGKFWVYKILETLPWAAKVGFLLGCLVTINTFYYAGEYFHRLMWPLVRREQFQNGHRDAYDMSLSNVIRYRDAFEVSVDTAVDEKPEEEGDFFGTYGAFAKH